MKRVLIGVVIVLLVGAAVLAAMAPRLVQSYLTRTLTQQGFQDVAITVERVGLRHITLGSVHIGNPALELSKIDVAFSPLQLLQGSVTSLNLVGLQLAVTQDEAGWHYPSIQSTASNTAPFTIPVTRAALPQPLPNLLIDKSQLNVTATGWRASVPFQLSITSLPAPTLRLTGENIALSQAGRDVAIANLAVMLTLDEAAKRWGGEWSMKEITLTSEGLVIPPLQAKGGIELTAEKAHLTGKLEDASQQYHAVFAVDYTLTKPKAAMLTLSDAEMPLRGGTIAAKNVKIPLSGGGTITTTLRLSHVPLATLMTTLAGNSATATGAVSGTIPVSITNGAVSIGKSTLQAEAPGIIALAPEVIPGDQAQVALVRDVMKNLHYTSLSLALSTAADHTLAATLAVEGRNPDLTIERPIKLQVNLSGDLLNLILQNLKLMNEPTEFIKNHAHEAPPD